LNHKLNWFLFTSACLSGGALGMVVDKPRPKRHMLRATSSSSSCSSSSSFTSYSTSFNSFNEKRALLVTNDSLNVKEEEEEAISSGVGGGKSKNNSDDDDDDDDDELKDGNNGMSSESLNTFETLNTATTHLSSEAVASIRKEEEDVYYKCRNYEIGVLFRSRRVESPPPPFSSSLSADSSDQCCAIQYVEASSYKDVLINGNEEEEEEEGGKGEDKLTCSVNSGSRSSSSGNITVGGQQRSKRKLVHLPVPYMMDGLMVYNARNRTSITAPPHFHDISSLNHFMSTKNWFQEFQRCKCDNACNEDVNTGTTISQCDKKHTVNKSHRFQSAVTADIRSTNLSSSSITTTTTTSPANTSDTVHIPLPILHQHQHLNNSIQVGGSSGGGKSSKMNVITTITSMSSSASTADIPIEYPDCSSAHRLHHQEQPPPPPGAINLPPPPPKLLKTEASISTSLSSGALNQKQGKKKKKFIWDSSDSE
jgi:hypothetical protein